MLKFYKLALRDLLHYKTRTILSVTGISIIVAVYLVLSSVSQGIGAVISETQGSERNLVALDKGNIDACEGVIREEIVSYLKTFPQLSHVSPMIHSFIFSEDRMIAIRVVNLEDYLKVHDVEIVKGKALKDGNYGILGEDASDMYGIDVGDKIEVVGNKIEIVGIFKSSGFVNSELWVSKKLGEKIFSRDTYTFVLMQVSKDENLQEVMEFLRNDSYLRNKIDIYTEKENWKEMGKQLDQMEDVMYLISVIALITIAFGIFNVLSMTVTEKTREIGMLRAVGLSKNEIQEIYLLEGMLQSFLGYIFGTIIGAGIIFYLKNYESVSFASMAVKPVLSVEQIGVALALTIVFALFGAYFPARRSSRIEIIKALRGI